MSASNTAPSITLSASPAQTQQIAVSGVKTFDGIAADIVITATPQQGNPSQIIIETNAPDGPYAATITLPLGTFSLVASCELSASSPAVTVS